MPKGLKPVRRKLATGELRVYWYHRATGKSLQHDPQTAEGLLEAAGLDDKAKALKELSDAPSGSFAALWVAYTAKESAEWTRLRPRTRSDYQKVRDWLGPAAQRAMVRAMTAPQIQRLKDRAEAEKGARFGKYVLQVIRLVLEWGKLRGWTAANPAMGMKQRRRPRTQRRVNRAWSKAELEAFAHGCPAQLLVPFVLGLHGMREGDAVRVTWSSYDGRSLEWVASKNREECSAEVWGPFKAILDEARKRRGHAAQIAVNAYGEPWTESGFRASFFKRVRKLVAVGALKPGCTFHGLRTTIGTLARDGAESEFRVAAAIGDRSTAMAEVYGRDADRERAQREVLKGVQKRIANDEWKLPDQTNGKRLSGRTRKTAKKPL